jgi:hypothetical protein
MSATDGSPEPLRFLHVLSCPCGERVTGDSEDALVEAALAHLRARHAERADAYEREHILAMAQRLVVT